MSFAYRPFAFCPQQLCSRRLAPLRRQVVPLCSPRWTLSNFSRAISVEAAQFPKIDRSKSKLFKSADEAVADLQPGSTILSAGFGLCGVAETLIQAIQKRGPRSLHSLTAVSNNAGVEDVGGLALLTKNGQVKKLIISFLGNNKALEKQYLTGDIEIELCPQGTLAERMRAAGAGIPAFYTPTGANTLLEDGKIPAKFDVNGNAVKFGQKREVREFNNKKFLMETALPGDVAIIRAHKADEAGNCIFKYTTKSFGPIMAKAARLAIVEADEIVPVGTFDADEVDLPGIFVDRIVPSTAPRNIEIKKLRTTSTSSKDTTSPKNESRARIARRAAKELKHGYYCNLGVGIPTAAAVHVPDDVNVWLQSENGILGMGDFPTEETLNPDMLKEQWACTRLRLPH